MGDCPFCLSANQLKGEILAQTPHCYLVRFDDPVLQSSVMIIPLRHVGTPFDLTREEWIATHDMLAKARQILDADAPDGYSIGWNVHPAGGQSIAHAHLHVIGRFADEPLAGQGIRHALRQKANRRPANTDRAGAGV
jgi:diadenosine tetraphosphate (Ap4A) HIT family hydrolase